METVFNKDGFAKWIFEQNSKLRMYNFDMFYDIRAILNLEQSAILKAKSENNNNYYPCDKPVTSCLYLFIRDTGTWISEEHELSPIYMRESKWAYKLTFCWNYSYMRDESFCTMEIVK